MSVDAPEQRPRFSAEAIIALLCTAAVLLTLLINAYLLKQAFDKTCEPWKARGEKICAGDAIPNWVPDVASTGAVLLVLDAILLPLFAVAIARLVRMIRSSRQAGTT